MGDPGIPSVEHQVETYLICKRIVDAVIADEEIPLPAELWAIRRALLALHRSGQVRFLDDSHVAFELPYQPHRALETSVFRLAHQIDRMRPVIEAVQKLEPDYWDTSGSASRIDAIESGIERVMQALRAMRGDE